MKVLLCMILAGGLLCTGCSQQTVSQVSEPESAAETTETALTSVTSVTSTAETAAKTLPVTTESTVTVPADEPVLIPPPEVSQPDYQGGDGGEENAETPLPENFTYRFYENGVSVRLAGGTYQSMKADLSAVSPLDAELGYYLYDSDFDGDLDLSVPVICSDAQKQFAVFLWNADDKHFSDTPVLLDNPQYFADVQHVCTLKQTANDATVTDAVWKDGVLTPTLTAYADAESLTLTVSGTDADGNEIRSTEKAADLDALTGLLLQYYNKSAVLPAAET